MTARSVGLTTRRAVLAGTQEDGVCTAYIGLADTLSLSSILDLAAERRI